MIERRCTPTSVDATGGKIRGTASVTYRPGDEGTEYVLWDDGGSLTVERIAVGAFDKHLKTNPPVVALFNHDANHVLGRTPQTLKLRTDSAGLHYEIDPPDTQVARELKELIARGDISGSSFAMVVDPLRDVEWQRDGEKEVRVIKNAKLVDVSPVTMPAYGATSVGLRSAERRALEDERDNFHARMETEKRVHRYEEIMRGC